jgi:hypothetical protein
VEPFGIRRKDFPRLRLQFKSALVLFWCSNEKALSKPKQKGRAKPFGKGN